MFQEFLTPTSVSEAVKLRHDLPSAMYLAGGTEVNSIVWPCRPTLSAKSAISLAKLPLRGIEADAKGMSIGALVTIQELVERADLPPLLAESVRHFANRNIRTMGTLGGNIAGNRPCSNIAPALLALDARVTFADTTGEKSVSLVEYFEKHSAEQLVLSFFIPAGWANRRWAVRKHTRTANDVSLVSVGVSFSGDAKRIENPIVAINGPVPHACRLTVAEERIAGKPLPDRPAIEALVKPLVSPVSDHRGGEAFKRHLAGVLVSDALHEAARRVEVAR